jgi:3-hydroxyisobutyrate dehydrogenase-like beta-hydroxyacid dehydrogenase
MGKGIAENLAKSSCFDLTVYSTKESKLDEFKKMCKVTNDYDTIFENCELLFLCLPGSPEVEEVVNSFIDYGVKDKTIIDLSTSYPISSIQLFNQVKDNGGRFFDASLSGGPKNASEGTVNVMIGGEEEGFPMVKPILDTFAKNVFFVGKPGTSNVLKLANNYLSIMYIALYAEIIPLLKKLDVNLDTFYDLVSVSGANSRMFELNAKKMIDQNFDLSFEMKLALKDLGYMKNLFEEHDASPDLLTAGFHIFNKAEQFGILNKDISELVKITEHIMESHLPSKILGGDL